MQKPAYKKKLKELDDLILAQKNNLAKASSQIIANAHNRSLNNSQTGIDPNNAYSTPAKNTIPQNMTMTTAQGSNLSNQSPYSNSTNTSNIKPGTSPQQYNSQYQSPQQTQPLSQSKSQ